MNGIIQKLKKIKRKITRHFDPDGTYQTIKRYYRKQQQYCFENGSCRMREQFEASITRLYHTVEKGLSYLDYRPGFGKTQIQMLVSSMEQYAALYETDAFFYRTALSCLFAYIEKNKVAGYLDEVLEERVRRLPGEPNPFGGTIDFEPLSPEALQSASYEALIKDRHSIRHFSGEPVDLEKLKKAVALAQQTPSACNRQGWRTRIVADRDKVAELLKNQNGNRGFGEEIDKLLVVTADLRYFQKEREIFQVFIDGGMYAANLLNALHYCGVGSIPLSASLLNSQEDNVRRLLQADDAEMLILMIGVGNYPNQCRTTRSERKPADIIIL